MSRKPLANHRLWKVKVIREAECECGWKSGMYIGKGANGFALEEWRRHVDQCARMNDLRRAVGEPGLSKEQIAAHHAAFTTCNAAGKR